ncbi:peptide-methionine (S)-S-oxide reductase [Candidatus Kaiserbacteria bacterium RIFCSPHIGHO2_01_FULL_49_13]|uniref:Peptide methionine sulfoxide reductase MsrA n=1 Tax=Candidatus Kaiserbacteria bacterium RIFCSPHIGHO2_01_FULL_49_13 TaxID=1798477 RepID=A0A1F6CCY0_9BACT|nr:MAG: peptide-methionine (S)-S-oxide reductase [Candidatus Kaiserbacteria bacterium RIFCSPHIGHO2_01_FULL_49_13]
MEKPLETAIFAAGCFWGVEVVFRNTKGVRDVVVGYTGGTKENPTYEQVCGGRTGHAEAVQVTYDPQQTTYRELLKVFFESHDPTTLNQQGPDIGHQYRSAIFYANEEQKRLAEEAKSGRMSERVSSRPIVTEIVPASTFWKAEEYHQQYLVKHGRATCAI